MSHCPYCKEPIEENWSFCHHCNKPLIVNIRNDRSIGTLQESYMEPDVLVAEDYTHPDEIQDEEIDRKILEIDEILKEKEGIGESVGQILL